MRAPDLNAIAAQCSRQVEGELKKRMRRIAWLEKLSLKTLQRPLGNRISDTMLLSYVRTTAPQDADLHDVNSMGDYVKRLYHGEFRGAQVINAMDLHYVIDKALSSEKAQDGRGGSQ